MLLSPLPPGVVALTTVRLFTDPGHTTGQRDVTPVLTDGLWQADLALVPPGRWYLLLAGEDADGGEVVWEPLRGYVDTPENPALVVTPESVAVRAKMPLPLTPEQRETITDAILDAQADVVAYLGRDLLPVEVTETDLWSWGADDTWDFKALGDEPLVRVLRIVAQETGGVPNGYFTVTYLRGLDAAHDAALHPIRRYITAHAMNSPEFTSMWKVATRAQGDVKSLSAEGQSVSFTTPTLGGGGDAGSGKPGALPTLGSLDRWRLAGRRVHQGPTRASAWPFTGSRWP